MLVNVLVCVRVYHINIAYMFIGTIGTIWITIAFPFLCNANAIAAHEIALFAFHLRTIHFVAVVTTVIVVIAFPTRLNASTVAASKFIRTACLI